MNIGMHVNRTSRELMEAAFHLTWLKMNSNNGVLRTLLAEGSKPGNWSGLAELSHKDNVYAATLIQWLGSPIGQCFLRDVQETAERLKREGFEE